MLRAAIVGAWMEAAARQRIGVVLCLLSVVVASLCASLAPLQLKRLVDALSRTPSEVISPWALVGLGLAYPGLRLAAGLAALIRPVALAPFSEGVRRRLIAMSVTGLPEGRGPAAATVKAIDRGAVAVGLVFQNLIIALAPLALESLLLSTIIANVLSPAVGALMLFVVVAYAGVAVLITQAAAAARRKLNSADTDLLGMLHDAVQNLEALRTPAARRWMSALIDRRARVRAARAVRAQTRASFLNLAWVGLSAMAHACALAYGIWAVRSGRMTLGDFVLLEASVLQLLGPLGAFGYIFRDTRNALGDLRQMHDRLAGEPPWGGRDQIPRGGDLAVIDGAVVGADGACRVTSLDLRIGAGARVALVGESGSGKSTLCRVLAGLQPLSSGTVTRGGLPALPRHLTRDCAYMGQDNFLLDLGVRRNIRLGGACEEDVQGAASLADLLGRLGVKAGLKGTSLSGGQGRLVMLARLARQRAATLILDEPTAGLNASAEAAVIRWMSGLPRSRTIILATHSLALASAADWIVLLRRGRIIDQGAASGMLRRHSNASRLWRPDTVTSAGDGARGR